MCRCYRGAALVFGGVLMTTSLASSDSCSRGIMTVYAAEDVQNEELTTAFQEDVQIGEENVETEIPTEGEEVIKSEEASLEAPTEETTPEETEEVLEEPAETEEEAEAEEVISVASDNSYGLGEQEYQILLKIVEAEAGGEDKTGKMLVANVVMNRVRSAQFPDTISEVVYERSEGRAQFSPTADGRIDKVTISSDTIEAVARVMSGEDVSAGALYFRAISSKEGWFDQSLNRVLEHGNHIFYTM